jgi:CheY-like chemotaxis protein
LKLLLVDDHPTFRIMAARMLSFLGHDVVEASNASEAETIFGQQPDQFEALMVDLFLGDRDGVTLVHRLESMSTRTLPVLFMSGDIEASRGLPGAVGPHRRFIEKPFSSLALETALRALCHP